MQPRAEARSPIPRHKAASSRRRLRQRVDRHMRGPLDLPPLAPFLEAPHALHARVVRPTPLRTSSPCGRTRLRDLPAGCRCHTGRRHRRHALATTFGAQSRTAPAAPKLSRVSATPARVRSSARSHGSIRLHASPHPPRPPTARFRHDATNNLRAVSRSSKRRFGAGRLRRASIQFNGPAAIIVQLSRLFRSSSLCGSARRRPSPPPSAGARLEGPQGERVPCGSVGAVRAGSGRRVCAECQKPINRRPCSSC